MLQGVVSIVPHLIYVGALNDENPTERKLGMDLGISILQMGFIDECGSLLIRMGRVKE